MTTGVKWFTPVVLKIAQLSSFVTVVKIGRDGQIDRSLASHARDGEFGFQSNQINDS